MQLMHSFKYLYKSYLKKKKTKSKLLFNLQKAVQKYQRTKKHMSRCQCLLPFKGKKELNDMALQFHEKNNFQTERFK